MTLTNVEIARFAPEVLFHAREKHFPMDPLRFIRHARLRHHRGLARDQGFDGRRRKWVTGDALQRNDSAYYNAPLDVIAELGPHSDGSNRRPLDAASGHREDVFLEYRWEKPRGCSRPTGKVPVFYYVRTAGSEQWVYYWWFHGYNDGRGPADTFNHQGDWEHVTARVRRGSLAGVWFSQHGKAKYIDAGEVVWRRSRFVVYCELGRHASHPDEPEDATDHGYRWKTWRLLLPLRDQPWRRFAGAWGKVGADAKTTGPLGPWHKLRRQ